MSIRVWLPVQRKRIVMSSRNRIRNVSSMPRSGQHHVVHLAPLPRSPAISAFSRLSGQSGRLPQVHCPAAPYANRDRPGAAAPERPGQSLGVYAPHGPTAPLESARSRGIVEIGRDIVQNRSRTAWTASKPGQASTTSATITPRASGASPRWPRRPDLQRCHKRHSEGRRRNDHAADQHQNPGLDPDLTPHAPSSTASRTTGTASQARRSGPTSPERDRRKWQREQHQTSCRVLPQRLRPRVTNGFQRCHPALSRIGRRSRPCALPPAHQPPPCDPA